jgi:hypothetical protein
VVWWSESLDTDPVVPGSIPDTTLIFREVMDLKRGPHNLVRIIEELLERNSSGSGLENGD